MAKTNLFFIFLFLFVSCSKNPITTFEGENRKKPYKVTIGKKLSSKEKKTVDQTLTKIFQRIDTVFEEISKINALEKDTPFPLSEDLETLLLFSKKIVDLSGGRFDPAISPLSSTWENSLKKKKAPSFEALQKACEASGWKHLALKPQELVKDRTETKIDLKALCKGWAIDLIVENLKALGYQNLLVEYSGNLRAIGKYPGKDYWTVFFDPHLTMEGQKIAPLKVKQGAISTSCYSLKKTSWVLPAAESQDKEIHKFLPIIDPLTAEPREIKDFSVASVSVIAPTSLLASGLSKAAMVFTHKKEVENWAREMSELYPDVSFWILSFAPEKKL